MPHRHGQRWQQRSSRSRSRSRSAPPIRPRFQPKDKSARAVPLSTLGGPARSFRILASSRGTADARDADMSSLQLAADPQRPRRQPVRSLLLVTAEQFDAIGDQSPPVLLPAVSESSEIRNTGQTVDHREHDLVLGHGWMWVRPFPRLLGKHRCGRRRRERRVLERVLLVGGGVDFRNRKDLEVYSHAAGGTVFDNHLGVTFFQRAQPRHEWARRPAPTESPSCNPRLPGVTL